MVSLDEIGVENLSRQRTCLGRELVLPENLSHQRTYLSRELCWQQGSLVAHLCWPRDLSTGPVGLVPYNTLSQGGPRCYAGAGDKKIMQPYWLSKTCQ